MYTDISYKSGLETYFEYRLKPLWNTVAGPWKKKNQNRQPKSKSRKNWFALKPGYINPCIKSIFVLFE